MNVSLQYIVYGVCIQTILRENGVGSCSNNGTHTKKSKIWRDQDVRGFETWVVRYQNYTAVKLGGFFLCFSQFFYRQKSRQNGVATTNNTWQSKCAQYTYI